MKRLNPKTNLPFKRGDIREDGWIFFQYQLKKIRNGYFVESWLKPEIFQKTNFHSRSGKDRTINNVATTLLNQAKCRCHGTPSRTKQGRKATNGVVTIDRDWILKKLTTGVCEATFDKLTVEPKKPNTASLDRINPNNPDYTPENARIVTWQFNNMKGAYTDEEFIRVAEALKNAKKRKSSRISKKNNSQSQNNS